MPYKDPEKSREYWRARYHEKTKHNSRIMEKRRQRNKIRYLSNPEKFRAMDVYKKYNLDYEEYKQKLLGQNNKCAICFLEFSKEKYPCVDHNHETNKVRGIVCSNCNLVLGNAKDNKKILESAIIYLKKYE